MTKVKPNNGTQTKSDIYVRYIQIILKYFTECYNRNISISM